MEMTKKDLHTLAYARELLENPGIAARLANIMGLPIEKGLGMLPASWTETIYQVTRASLQKALDVAVNTLGKPARKASLDLAHKMAVAATGAVGGAFGLPALSVELPVSTTLMLRSIADIAQSEGEKIHTAEGKLACLEVFALSGSAGKAIGSVGLDETNAVDTGYYAVRGALARAVSEAAKFIVEKGIVEEGAPVLVRLITRIASRFSVAVTQKVVAQAVPLVGAAGGAAINTIFMDHFQNMARGHFIIRRLEGIYGADQVQAAYAGL